MGDFALAGKYADAFKKPVGFDPAVFGGTSPQIGIAPGSSSQPTTPKTLEKALAKRMQVRHAQLVSSGTAALTVALASAGIGAGDEVIMPTFTFVASFESILAIGAIPVLVDVDDTLTLDPIAVENAVTERTKVVMPVHMCGSMADLKALKTICKKHGLILLEDACQAIGGSFAGVPLGGYGDLGCFSFDYVKTVTCCIAHSGHHRQRIF